eukprot:scaffold71173_cov30-Tisochrysis_lutea.AAC.2
MWASLVCLAESCSRRAAGLSTCRCDGGLLDRPGLRLVLEDGSLVPRAQRLLCAHPPQHAARERVVGSQSRVRGRREHVLKLHVCALRVGATNESSVRAESLCPADPRPYPDLGHFVLGGQE